MADSLEVPVEPGEGVVGFLRGFDQLGCGGLGLRRDFALLLRGRIVATAASTTSTVGTPRPCMAASASAPCYLLGRRL